MVKYRMLKTRAVTASSVVEQILIYSDCQTYMTRWYECVLMSSYLCPQLLQLTVAGLSRWHSPPQLLLSVQTQTGPDPERERWGEGNIRAKVVRRMVRDRTGRLSWIMMDFHLKSAAKMQTHTHTDSFIVP